MSDEIKGNVSEWGTVGCKNCKSPFHTEEKCPQTKNKESKFRFRTRQELGLKPGELPFKFRVEIAEKDDVTEVIRKRALLRLNSDRVYKQMSYATKAADAQRAVLNWLLQLGDNMDEEDKKTLIPIVAEVQKSLTSLEGIKQTKIEQAVKMEEVVQKARKTARKARIRQTKKQAKKDKRDFWVLRLPETSLDIPVLADGENPLQYFEEAADAILEAEKNKTAETEE